MKVSSYFDANGHPTMEYQQALAAQNGHKTRALRAAAKKGQQSKRKRRLAARRVETLT